MIKGILIVTMVLFVGKIVLLSQNCGVKLNCDHTKKYPYLGCDNQTHCMTNPTQVKKPTDVPICLVYDNTDEPPAELHAVGGTGTVLVYQRSLLQDDIDCGEYNWNCICGKENATCKCHINIRFSKSTRDFPDRKILATARIVSSSCVNSCNEDIPTWGSNDKR